MPLDILNADHIGANGGFEPQRSNNGLLWLTDPTGDLSRDDIRLSIQSFPVPKRSMGIIEVGYLNEKRKFPGMPTYDDLSVIFKDYVDRETADILWRWAYRVHDPITGKTGLASSYKLNGWMSLYSPEGSIERRYNIVGCWPSAIDPGEVDHEAEDAIRITMTLTIDKAVPITAQTGGRIERVVA